MLNLPLAWRALIRDMKSGELTLLFMALIIAVTCVSAVGYFSSLVNYQLNQQARHMLGADVQITSNTPIPHAWQAQARQWHLSQTQTLSFLSMVAHKDNLQLAQIKSISNGYPLHGQITTAATLFDQTVAANGVPVEGEVWVGARLFPLLAIRRGDTIGIGAATFKVTQVLMDEPGQAADWFTISPKIIMNHKDVSKTQVIQMGSNITYQWLLSGSDSQLRQLKTYLTPFITESQWLDSTKTPTVIKTIERSLIYLQLGTLMTLVLAAVAISMASLRYSRRQAPLVAVLRCFGASKNTLFFMYLGSMLLLGLFACSIGVGLGYLLQPLFRYWLRGFLVPMEAPLTLQPALLSFACGMLVLLSFTLANLLRLREVGPMAIFCERYAKHDTGSSLSYGLGLLLLSSLAYVYTQSWQITLLVVMGCVFFILMAMGILVVCATIIAYIKPYIPLGWRIGFANIERNLANSVLQIVGIGLTLTAIVTVSLLRNHLISDWQRQIPKKAPNFFVINIDPSQLQGVHQFLKQSRINDAALYPMVRGRLTSINGSSVTKTLGAKAQEINALQRELNLSWTPALPPGNTLAAGNWPTNPNTPNWVSVEQGLAEKMGLKLGDTLGFTVAGQPVSATIQSIRTVNWANFKPNFFILFKPGMLNKLPQTYITSLYLSDEQQPTLVRFVKTFPNVNIIDIANTLKTIQHIIASSSQAISFLSLFGLLSGLIIATLAMLSFSDQKRQETYVLKVLGMRANTLLWIRSSEASIVGFLAGLLAISTATVIHYYLSRALPGLTFIFPWRLFIAIPMISSAMTLLINALVMWSQYQQRHLN